ncbi:hypothetical protein AHAS_Ahas14G0053400 [Arachis hypogaea]
MTSPPLFRHKRRTHEGGNKTAKELSHRERRRASDLLPPVRPSPNHVAVCEAVSIAAAGGRHRSRRSTSVILLFTVSCPRLEPCFLFVVSPCPRFPAAMSVLFFMLGFWNKELPTEDPLAFHDMFACLA